MTEKRFLCLLFLPALLGWSIPGLAQKTKQAHWQQRVEYKIEVRLDPDARLLHGELRLTYFNQSPDTLREIYMHLWPNAYRSSKTPLGKQLLENGKTDFETAKSTSRGFLDSTHWKIGSETVAAEQSDSFGEIVRLILKEPLKPGESLQISTPFRVYVPDVFSRMGTGMGTWQITQWFPKPAVYDVNGWNPMPYLDQGEFYCTFGSFDVEISLPKNMLVAATGRLLTHSEHQLREDRIKNPLDASVAVPPSSEYKTLRFVQDSIHDFAWFASANYNIVKDYFTDAEGRSIESWVFGADAPDKLAYTDAISKALNFYGKNCGPYPYTHCTVVKGELEAGGGMEYPMVTICDILNDEVVVHEVGHNWFQGMLASNERRYPWMDESVNSFMENLCLQEGKENGGADINNIAMSAIYRDLDVLKAGQAIGAPSEEFSWNNYGVYVYGKGAHIFNYLRDVLGDSVFWNCMRAYYRSWAFKHPLPGDMQAVFEKESGKNLNWFFDQWIDKNAFPDYKIWEMSATKNPNGTYSYGLDVITLNGNTAPIKFSFYKGDKLLDEAWLHHPLKDPGLIIELDKTTERADRVMISDGYAQFDVNPQNNGRKVKGLFPGLEPIKPKIGIYRDKAQYTEFAWMPVYGWNAHNKSMAGLLLHNRGIPGKRFQYFLLPMWSFSSSALTGYAKLLYQLPFDKGSIQRTDFQLSARQFGFEHFAYLQQYSVIEPGITLNYRKKRYRSGFSQKSSLKGYFLSFQEYISTEDQLLSPLRNPANIVRARHELENKRIKNPYKAQMTLEYGKEKNDDFLKLSTRMDYTFSYREKGKRLELGIFGGAFINESTNGLYHFRAAENNGAFDYLFEHPMLGRTAGEGILSQQVLPTEDRAKFVGALGNASEWMWACNLQTTLPGKIPFKLYVDIVGNNIFDQLYNVPLVYQAGINLSLFDGIFEVYLPLNQSQIITDNQRLNQLDRYNRQITFRLDLDRLNPFELAKTIKLF